VRIAFFNTKPYERAAFDVANARHGHPISYLEPRLTADTARLAAGHPAVCGFVNDRFDAPVLATLAAGGTRLVALRCAGFNNVDLAAAKAHGLTVCRVPAYSPHAVAEHALALVLTLNRKTHKAYNRVREGNFALDGLTGFDLHGKTAGVVGTGAIGAVACRILAGFGCRVLAHDPKPNPDATAAGATYVPLADLLTASDIVTLHCPLTPDTRHLIDAAALAAMKPGAVLVNTGRGALVDTPALVAALKAGRLGAVGLDVYEEEDGVFFADHSAEGVRDDQLARLLTFPNVLVTGHQAFLTHEALAGIAETTLANVGRFERGEGCPNRVAGG
jgi:D-lactate dehydrogenase